MCSVLQALSSEEYGKDAAHFSKFSYGHDMVCPYTTAWPCRKN